MTWAEFQNLLNSESEKLEVELAECRFPSILDPLQMHCSTKRVVDSAVEEFAETRVWPELDKKSRQMLLERLRFGRQIVSQLAAQYPDLGIERSVLSDSNLIRSVLVDAWNDESGVLGNPQEPARN